MSVPFFFVWTKATFHPNTIPNSYKWKKLLHSRWPVFTRLHGQNAWTLQARVSLMCNLVVRWLSLGGEPERACIADLIFCQSTQIMDNFRVCHCLLFHEQGKQTSCSLFSSQGSYYATHTLGLNFTMKSWAESPVLMSVLCMALTQSKLNYFAWFNGTVCEQPACLS